MESIVSNQEIDLWISSNKIITNGNDYGNGNANGNGYGNGNGNGYGYANGSGYGNGDGDSNGYGYANGDGYGDGNGYGDGYGYGNGDGDGYGYGNADGNGYGNGDGNGDGLKSISGNTIYSIDEVHTVITNIKNNIAKGFIVQSDLSLIPCYIAKSEGLFAHGKTIKEATTELQNKLLLKLPIEERIENFLIQFSNLKIKYKAIHFYNWHFLLTGSCSIGRQYFVKDKNINLQKDKFTVLEFLEITKQSYGSNIITQIQNKLLKH